MSFRSHIDLPPALATFLDESDHVLVCQHLARSKRFTMQTYFTRPESGKFSRDDGTEGHVSICVVCDYCKRTEPGEVRFIEYFWGHGRLHMYDGHVCPECREAGVTPQ